MSQCPFESGRDEVCKCPKGPRVPTGRYYGQTLKIHIALPAVTLACSVRCVRSNVREALQDAARSGLEKDVGVCEEKEEFCAAVFVFELG